MWRGPRPPTLDVVLALVLTTATQVEVWTGSGVAGPVWSQAVVFALATGAVVIRRVASLAAVSVVAAALTLQVTFLPDAAVVGGFIAAILCTYSVAAHATVPSAVVGAGVMGLAIVAEPVADAGSRSPADALGNAVVFGAVWGLGWLVRRLRERGHHLEERATTAEEEARRAVQAERERIAGELHDVVAYSVSLMVLQAGAARQLLDPGHRACAPLLTVEDTGRQALEEMHRMLVVLRRSDEGDRAPLASLDQLPLLVAQVRAAGLPVDLQVDGQPRALPAGVDLAAYRIVQEALTNVLKHGGRARARVVLRYGEADLGIEVSDDGQGKEATIAGFGHGLMGLRERAALYGGRLLAGPREGGGFAVTAALPLPLHRAAR